MAENHGGGNCKFMAAGKQRKRSQGQNIVQRHALSDPLPPAAPTCLQLSRNRPFKLLTH